MEFSLFDSVIHTKWNGVTATHPNNINVSAKDTSKPILQAGHRLALYDLLRYYDPRDTYNGLIRVRGPHEWTLWTTSANRQLLYENQLQLEDEDLLTSKNNIIRSGGGTRVPSTPLVSGTPTAATTAAATSNNNGRPNLNKRGSMRDFNSSSNNNINAMNDNNAINLNTSTHHIKPHRHASTVLANITDDLLLPVGSITHVQDEDESKDELLPSPVIPAPAPSVALLATGSHKKRLSSRLNFNKVDIEDFVDNNNMVSS